MGLPSRDGNESQSSSELSYSYQYDLDNDANAGKAPLATQPPFKDVEAQHIYEPSSTQVFHKLESQYQRSQVKCFT
jgi:hypothetical protein